MSLFGVETLFSSPAELLLVALIVAAAQAVYVLLGFGAGLVSVGCLVLLLPDVRDAVVLLLLVCLPAELGVVRSSWKSISWRGVAALLVGIGAGIPLGAWLLRFGKPSFLLVVLGAFLVLSGVAFLRSPSARRGGWPPWVAPGVGLVSGVLTGLFGTGGPPLVLYYRASGADKAAFRGNLMAVFLLQTAVRVPVYALLGLIAAAHLVSALLLLPAVALGAWLGHRVHLGLAESGFRRLVSAALLLIGLLLLVPGAG